MLPSSFIFSASCCGEIEDEDADVEEGVDVEEDVDVEEGVEEDVW
jgi:hypothetical protein